MSSLPQELLDEIIGYLPSNNMELLRHCSLVAKSWMDPSRKGLFESVETGPGGLRPWLGKFSGHYVTSLKHVRRLSCSEEDLFSLWPTNTVCDDSLSPAVQDDSPSPTVCDNLPSPCQLTHLTLLLCDVFPQEIDSFSAFAFKSTLSSITLLHCSVSKIGLTSLINYFPKLECLSLESIRCCNESHEEIAHFGQTHLKKLYLKRGFETSSSLLDWLSESRLRSDEITLGRTFPRHGWVSYANNVIRVFGDNLKCLRLPEIHSGMCNLVSVP